MKNILVIFILLLSVSFIHSQSSDTSNIEKNSLVKNSWSLQFAIGNNFTLQSLDGLMFSLKYHQSDKSALRFGVGINWKSNTGHLDINDGNTKLSEPLNQNNLQIIMMGNFITYFADVSVFNLYLGGGPRLSVTHNLSENEGYDSARIRFDYETISWAAGLTGVFGIEWFPTKKLSLFAEYLAYATIGATTETRSNVDQNFNSHVIYKRTSTDIIFNGTTARLGLSIYF